MLIPFRSKAASDFFMFEHHARALFALVGLEFSARGVISCEQVSLYAGLLSAALDKQELDFEDRRGAETPSSDELVSAAELTVGLKQRAWPLLDMLRKSAVKNADVVWGSDI